MDIVRDRLTELTQESNLDSLLNVDTRKLALYVMQNDHGLIRIGRSASPERRRIDLERRYGVSLETVLIIEKAGHLEEWIHLILKAIRLEYEWFAGDDSGRAAIEGLFGVRLKWPYVYDAAAAQEFLDVVGGQADANYERRCRRDLLQRIKSSVQGVGLYADYKEDRSAAGLESTIGRLADGFHALVFGVRRGQTIVTGVKKGNRQSKELPHYSRDMEAALRLWSVNTPPEKRRPVKSALDCCLAALCDRWNFDETRLRAAGCEPDRKLGKSNKPIDATVIQAVAPPTRTTQRRAPGKRDKVRERREERLRYWKARALGMEYEQVKQTRGPDKQPGKRRTQKALTD